MITPKTLPGFMELMPKDQIMFNKIIDIIRKNFEKNGFLPLDTPIIESSEVLLAKAGGETEKQIYSFTKGENNLCLRFDLTVPLAKFVAQNISSLNFPFSRYQIGKVYRGEKPQKGRFREFYQCDIDVVGRDKLGLLYDAQIPSVIASIFKELDVGEFVINISNRKILFGFLEFLGLGEKITDILRVIDKFDKIGKEKIELILKDDMHLSQKIVNKILDFLEISGSKTEQIEKLKKLKIKNETFLLGVCELEKVVGAMQKFGVEDKNFEINLKIARGLDYYTGTVYETFIKGHENIGSVSSGGRYDNLASYYTSAKLPGVGMSIGLTRLFYKLKENGMLKSTSKTLSKAIILPMDDGLFEECIDLCSKLKSADVCCEVYLQEAKFKAKLSYADKSQVEFAIIVGEEEAKSKIYTLKNMKTGEQKKLAFDELISVLK